MTTLTADTITDAQIRELRKDTMREWRERGKATSWPEGKRVLSDCQTALTDRRSMAMQLDDVRAGVYMARERCADILNARRDTKGRHAMRLTAATITDKQILPLLGTAHDATARGALLLPSQHGSLGHRVRRECRARCAEILNARAAKGGTP